MTISARLLAPESTRPAAPENVVDGLLEQGYLPGAPAHITAWAMQCDRQAAAESPCPRCGRMALEYAPWHQSATYVAVATCTVCTHEFDF